LTKFLRRNFDQAFDDERGFRTARAPIGIDRHGVGIDGVYFAVDGRQIVLARQQRRVEIGRDRRREGRHVGAQIGDRLDAECRHLAAVAEGEFRVGDVVAAMGVGQKSLGALAHPLDRTADPLGRPQADDLFGIDEDLGTETTAHIGGDDAQLVLRRHAHECRDDEPRHMRVLGRVPQGEVLIARIVLADRRPRLHGVGHQAVVDDVELGHMFGRGERGIDRAGLAEMPLKDRVSGHRLMDLRRTRLLGLGGIDHRRQDLVADLDLLRRVARLPPCLGDHDGDRIARIAGLAVGDGGMRRHLHRRAVLGMDHPAADQVADLVAGEVGAGEHGQDAGHLCGGRRVDRVDLGVRVRRAQKMDVRLPGPADVVGILALAGDEAEIFLAAHRRADAGRAHGRSPPELFQP
jgi:hypothetical protein